MRHLLKILVGIAFFIAGSTQLLNAQNRNFYEIVWTKEALVVAYDAKICTFKSENLQLSTILQIEGITAIDVNEATNQLIVGRGDGYLDNYDLPTGEYASTVQVSQSAISDLEVIDNRIAVIVRDERLAGLWNLDSIPEIIDIASDLSCQRCNPFSLISASPDGHLIALETIDILDREEIAAIWIWDIESETEQTLSYPLTLPPINFLSMDFHPDNRILLATTDDGQLIFWDLSTQELLGTSSLSVDGYPVFGRFSPDGDLLAVGGYNISIFKVAFADTGYELTKLIFMNTKSSVKSLAFDSTGLKLAALHLDGSVTVWEIETGHQITQLEACKS